MTLTWRGTTGLIAKLKGMLKEIGCHDHLMSRSLYLGKNIPIGGTAHQAGTMRFGHDPEDIGARSELQST